MKKFFNNLKKTFKFLINFGDVLIPKSSPVLCRANKEVGHKAKVRFTKNRQSLQIKTDFISGLLIKLLTLNGPGVYLSQVSGPIAVTRLDERK